MSLLLLGAGPSASGSSGGGSSLLPAPTYFLGLAYWTSAVQQEISVTIPWPATDYDFAINGNVTGYGVKTGSSLMISWDYFNHGPPSVDIWALDPVTAIPGSAATVQMDQNITVGTPLYYYCDGTTLMGWFADGYGSYYVATVEEFSAQCST